MAIGRSPHAGATTLLLGYNVWTLVDVKRLAFLAPKRDFAGPGLLPGLGIQLGDILQFSPAIGFFWVICRYIAHRLAWRLNFHVAISPVLTQSLEV
jgi:hypothetical protein